MDVLRLSLRTTTVLSAAVALLAVCASCTSSGRAGDLVTTAPSGTTAPSTPSSSPASATSTPSSGTTTAPADVAAGNAVRAYYRVTDQLLSDPASDIDAADRVAGGDELDEVRRLVQQQRLQGEQQRGSVLVVSVDPTQTLPGPPPSVHDDVCLDVSGVTVTDAEGKSVVAADRAPRSLVHVVVVDRGTSGWLVEQTDARGEPCAGS